MEPRGTTGGSAERRPGGEIHRRPVGLSAAECGLATIVLAMWLVLFTGGTVVDTKPYRYAISPEGVWAMDGTIDGPPERRYIPPEGERNKIQAWFVVLCFYLPINLALICMAAGTLGAFGCRANLQSDEDKRVSSDNSSPYASAMLRGFFVYLFLTSGLLLLDDNPFDRASPGQYIRLAGFLSLMSFVINYQPHVFSQLITWAFQRIQARSGDSEQPSGNGAVHQTRTSAELVAVHTEVERTVTTATVNNQTGTSSAAPENGTIEEARPSELPHGA